MGANLGGDKIPTTPQVENLRKLGLTDAEIADVLATDKEIDQGVKHFELAEELKPGAKKARRADRTDNPKKAVRERKEDADKVLLMHCLMCGVEGYDPVQTGTGTFELNYNGRKFKVVLSCPRS